MEYAVVSKKLFALLSSYVAEKDASAPNTIQDAVYDLLLDNGFGQTLAEDVSEQAFGLVSSLVKDIGEYY